VARPEGGVTEEAADALQNPRPLHHSLFGDPAHACARAFVTAIDKSLSIASASH